MLTSEGSETTSEPFLFGQWGFPWLASQTFSEALRKIMSLKDLFIIREGPDTRLPITAPPITDPTFRDRPPDLERKLAEDASARLNPSEKVEFDRFIAQNGWEGLLELYNALDAWKDRIRGGDKAVEGLLKVLPMTRQVFTTMAFPTRPLYRGMFHVVESEVEDLSGGSSWTTDPDYARHFALPRGTKHGDRTRNYDVGDVGVLMKMTDKRNAVVLFPPSNLAKPWFRKWIQQFNYMQDKHMGVFSDDPLFGPIGNRPWRQEGGDEEKEYVVYSEPPGPAWVFVKV